MAETVFTVNVPLRWGDMDAYGHVNNVTMMRILEEARIAVFGLPPSAGEPVGASPLIPLFEALHPGTQALVVENWVKYRAQLAYRGEDARVEVRVVRVSPATITVSYELFDAVTGEHCVSGSTTLAFFHAPTQTLVRLSKEQRSMLSEYVAAP
ncbi:thioesterase family protein [Rothia sp. ZJ932]|uniref:acyl-CoA thioesterase n=1 Tax=Rothia sp. ZJ932 TaxID=2810516 RepID=UPI00196718BC|nr:thioesterase family protein [Rothia sp. ZJ932]QRZ61367.1 thioesterase family protein [Rothia sp. ZJ932]